MKTFIEFLTSVFGWNRRPFLIAFDFAAVFIATVAGALASLWGWVEKEAVDMFPYVTFILVVVIADFATGVMVAAKQGKFETRKARKLAGKIAAAGLIFLIAHWGKKVEPVLLLWLPEAVLIPIVLIDVSSILKNLSLLGLVKPHVAGLLWRHVDAYKNPPENEQPAEQPIDTGERKQY